MDLSLSSAVLWSLLPPDAHIGFITFLGVYAAAVIAGIVSHVPGGVGVFEAVILLTLPGVPADALLGSLLAYRARVLPGAAGVRARCCSARRSWRRSARASPGRRSSPRSTSRRWCRRSPARSPSSPGRCCCSPVRRRRSTSGWRSSTSSCRSRCWRSRTSAGSIVGLGLLVLARALFRRVRAAYHISRVAAGGGHLRLAPEGTRLRGGEPARCWCWGC